ncbi:UDP-N-acetylmuramate--L-alanine ligase [Bacillus sp. NA_146.1]
MKKIHFIGIGGTGMSPLAKIMLEKGYVISGSDIKKNESIENLINQGVMYFQGHNPSNVKDCDLVIYTSALLQDNPELIEASRKGIPCIHRSELIVSLSKSKKGIYVGGTHGKTTTTSMITHIFKQSGKNPTYAVGGILNNYNTNGENGNDAFCIFEACESDKSIKKYSPHIGIITNIETDHLEYYDGNFENLLSSFFEFSEKIDKDGHLIICASNSHKFNLIKNTKCKITTIDVWNTEDEIDYTVDYSAKVIQMTEVNTIYQLYNKQNKICEITINIPGIHNVYNSLYALAAGSIADISMEDIIRALNSFKGVKQRYQKLVDGDVTVIEDNAHHPTEIKMVIELAKMKGNRVIVLFQAQRSSRLYYLFNEFIQSFKRADVVLVADTYSPIDETTIYDVSAKDLVKGISRYNQEVKYYESMDDIKDNLLNIAQKGDIILSLGIAGDTSTLIKDVASFIKNEEIVTP